MSQSIHTTCCIAGNDLAIQDAVARANLLIASLRESYVSDIILKELQRRREGPTRMTQRLQVMVHRRILRFVFESQIKRSLPWFIRSVLNFPMTRRLPARVLGMVFRQ